MNTKPTVNKNVIVVQPAARGGASTSLRAPRPNVGAQHPERPARDGFVAQVLSGLRFDQNLIYLQSRLKSYAESCEARLRGLRSAVEAADFVSVEHLAHSLTESTARVGATQMMKLCIALQLTGRRGLLSSTKSLLAELEQEYERFKESLIYAVG